MCLRFSLWRGKGGVDHRDQMDVGGSEQWREGNFFKILVFTFDKYKSSNNMLTSSSQWNFDVWTQCPTALTGFEQETLNNGLTPQAFRWNSDLGCCLLFLLLGQAESYLIDFISLWADVTRDQPFLSFYSMTSIQDHFPLWSHWSSKSSAVQESRNVTYYQSHLHQFSIEVYFT